MHLLCGSGRTGATAITSSQLRSGEEHSDLGLLFRSGTTAVTSLQFRFGGEHSDPGLAVRVGGGHCDHELLAPQDKRAGGTVHMKSRKLHLWGKKKNDEA